MCTPHLFQNKFHTKLVTQLVIQLFYCSIFPTKVVHLIFQPNLANHFSHTISNNNFHPFPSHNFPTQLFQHFFKHNFQENLYNKIVHAILHQVFQLTFTLKSYTQLFHTVSIHFPHSFDILFEHCITNTVY